MFSLVLLTVLAQAPEPASPSGLPPEQVLASIDTKGTLTITYVSCACLGYGTGETTVPAHEIKDTGKVPARAKVKVTSVMVTTAELSVKYVEAYTADGRAVSAEKLKTLLAKERTVLAALDGKKVDPFHLQLYKDDTLVLVLPPNTLNQGGGMSAYGPPVAPSIIVPDPGTPKRPMPDEKPKD